MCCFLKNFSLRIFTGFILAFGVKIVLLFGNDAVKDSVSYYGHLL